MFKRKNKPIINEYGSYSGPDFDYEDSPRLYKSMLKSIREKREKGLSEKIIGGKINE